jgi:predicted GTPase
VSALTGDGIKELKDRIAALKPQGEEGRLVADKINAGDLVLLVVPIDKAAPKGRLILPQQQAIRDILDAGAAALVVQDSELADMLAKLGDTKPALVITDSQVFGKVDRIVPSDVPMTSCSSVRKSSLASASSTVFLIFMFSCPLSRISVYDEFMKLQISFSIN